MRSLVHLAFVCVAPALLGQSVARIPEPTGKYAVGRTLMHFVDAARMDPTAAEDGTQREFMALVWYPGTAAEPVYTRWMPPLWAPHEGEFLYYVQRRSPNPLTLEQARNSVGAVVSHSVEGAELSRARRRWPLLLFGPGAGQNPVMYTSLCEDLASHGYIVMASAPTGWLAMAVFPDGRKVPWSRKRSDDPAWINGTALPLWAGDLRFMLEQAAILNLNTTS